MIEKCPSGPGPERDKWIFESVASGNFEATFSEITCDLDGHEGKFYVFSDALKIDGVRINVSAELEQRIADLLGCRLLTPKMADLIWTNREVSLKPFTMPITSLTEHMIENSKRIDAALEKLGAMPGKLLCTIGKHWVLDNDLLSHPGMAENYGWHFEGNIGIVPEWSVTKGKNGQLIQIIQGRGWAHNTKHVDYSQICQLVSRLCIMDGKRAYLDDDVLKDPVLSFMVSHDGPLKILRQPGVPDFDGTPMDFLPNVPDEEAFQK